MKKYAIWDKQSPILTTIGEVLTPEEWIDRHPIAGLDRITVICSAGEINGGFFGTLGNMVDIYTRQGCEFTDDMTAEQKLEAIEAFEDAKAAEAAQAVADAKAMEEMNAASTASIAASLEYQNMMSLDDAEVE